MRHGWVLVLAVGLVAAARGDDADDAKAQVAKAEAVLKKITALRAKGVASDYEVTAAELDANRARAVLARLSGDEKEEQYRKAIVAGSEAAVARMEQLTKIGAVSAEEADLVRRNLAAAKIDLAFLYGDQKAITTQLHVLVAIEERRLGRAKTLFARGVLAKGELDAQQKALDDARDRLKKAGRGVD